MPQLNMVRKHNWHNSLFNWVVAMKCGKYKISDSFAMKQKISTQLDHTNWYYCAISMHSMPNLFVLGFIQVLFRFRWWAKKKNQIT